MSPVLAQHSAATVEHGTPHEVVAMARHVFGDHGIACDPFSSAYWNEHVVKADAYYDAEQDSLDPARIWMSGDDPEFATYFINCPGGLVKEAWSFARDRWQEGSAVFWCGFNIEQLSYLQTRGAMFRGFRRVIPPARLAFLRRPGDVAADLNRRIIEADAANDERKARALRRQLGALLQAHPDPDGPPVKGASPTHSNYLLLMPSEEEQVRRFDGAVKLMHAEAF